MTQPENPEFVSCRQRGQITPFPDGKRAMAKELAAARRNLGTAKESLDRGDAEWATAQAYYAAFHAGRALLYWQEYREHSHLCLWIALKALYVDQGRLLAEVIARGARTKQLREDANYAGEFSASGALEAIETAEGLISAAVEQTGQSALF